MIFINTDLEDLKSNFNGTDAVVEKIESFRENPYGINTGYSKRGYVRINSYEEILYLSCSRGVRGGLTTSAITQIEKVDDKNYKVHTGGGVYHVKFVN